MSVKPTVLIYNFTDRKRKNKIQAFCRMHGIRVKSVSKEDYARPLRTLFEVSLEVQIDDRAEEPVNQEWNSVRLYHEIKSEHEQMTGQTLRK